ncbi:GGDEF domain-containing protein [Noviherbaspirillum massiliense]|uniref:GGDEF domain-containing protein n=1 Tax=Noviherbaspirillum massiliense TaxID=1465823 RepID=UPI0002E76052|nr:GGDEF domain-containing protein [Noviherbaspirillum massiliense]
MLDPFNLLLLTAALCIVMLFVLGSLIRSGIPGIRQWVAANGLAFVALLLYATRGIGPAFLSIEVANTVFALAIAAVLAGFRKFFGRPIPSKMLIGGLIYVAAGISVFHYGVESMTARIVVVSIFHAATCLFVGLTIFQSIGTAKSRYSYFFTGGAALLFAFAHVFRGFVYGIGADALSFSFQSTGWNVLFFSIGTLVLPILTMGAVMMVHDTMMAKAVDAANRDFLTGTWSRRAFLEFAEHEVSRARRTGRVFSLLLLDIDYFKNINDTFGHAVGDRVLVDIAARVRKEIRTVDCLSRIGGEEFAVLLPETSHSAALLVGERLRAALDQQISANIAGNKSGNPVRYSASIGVGTMQEGESFSELMQRTDIALYAAKASGRNAVFSTSKVVPASSSPDMAKA